MTSCRSKGVFSDYYYYLNTHMKLASGTLTQPHDPAAERAGGEKSQSLVGLAAGGGFSIN